MLEFLGGDSFDKYSGWDGLGAIIVVFVCVDYVGEYQYCTFDFDNIEFNAKSYRMFCSSYVCCPLVS